jgi:hypothetical protein
VKKHPLTPGYIFFYLLFSPDTWRVLTGVVMSLLIVPSLSAGRELSSAGKWMVWIMVAGIGYGFSGLPAKKFSAFLRKKVMQLTSRK